MTAFATDLAKGFRRGAEFVGSIDKSRDQLCEGSSSVPAASRLSMSTLHMTSTAGTQAQTAESAHS